MIKPVSSAAHDRTPAIAEHEAEMKAAGCYDPAT
jgi:hypothetical protein